MRNQRFDNAIEMPQVSSGGASALDKLRGKQENMMQDVVSKSTAGTGGSGRSGGGNMEVFGKIISAISG